jgi:hypothetical protein
VANTPPGKVEGDGTEQSVDEEPSLVMLDPGRVAEQLGRRGGPSWSTSCLVGKPSEGRGKQGLGATGRAKVP